MTYIEPTHMSQNVYPAQSSTHNAQQLRSSVWQDNPTQPRERIASHQPDAPKKDLRSQSMNRKTSRSQKRSTPKRRTTQLIVWVNPLVKAEIQRRADREGLSLSATGAALLEHALQADIDLQYGALLQPIIEQAIRTQMRGISTRLAWLLVRVAFDAGQTRSLVTNILGRQPGISDTELTAILDGSSKTAKGNITRKTPQLTELIAAVEQWISTEERENNHA